MGSSAPTGASVPAATPRLPISRTLGHAPGTAAWTEAAAFAAERHKLLGMAGVAKHAQEAVFQAAALEIICDAYETLMIVSFCKPASTRKLRKNHAL